MCSLEIVCVKVVPCNESLVPLGVVEGSQCLLDNGYPGICKKIIHCPPRAEEVLKGNRHAGSKGRCGWNGPIEIVCCPTRRAEKILHRPARFSSAYQEYKRNEIKPRKQPKVASPLLSGVEVQPGEFPYAVALGYKNTDTDANSSSLKYICGGSLISSEHVLTAAHCVNNIQDDVPIEVHLGNVNIRSTASNVQRIPISNIILHPKYRPPSIYYDVAIIKLMTKISESVKPVCLPTKPLHSFTMTPRTPLVVIGRGWMDFYDEKANKLLIMTRLSFVSREECREYYNESIRLPHGIDDTMICAKGINAVETSICPHESGGPLVMLTETGDTLVGITSFGVGCGTDVPDVYAAVHSYLDWIEEQVWPNPHVTPYSWINRSNCISYVTSSNMLQNNIMHSRLSFVVFILFQFKVVSLLLDARMSVPKFIFRYLRSNRRKGKETISGQTVSDLLTPCTLQASKLGKLKLPSKTNVTIPTLIKCQILKSPIPKDAILYFSLEQGHQVGHLTYSAHSIFKTAPIEASPATRLQIVNWIRFATQGNTGHVTWDSSMNLPTSVSLLIHYITSACSSSVQSRAVRHADSSLSDPSSTSIALITIPGMRGKAMSTRSSMVTKSILFAVSRSTRGVLTETDLSSGMTSLRTLLLVLFSGSFTLRQELRSTVVFLGDNLHECQTTKVFPTSPCRIICFFCRVCVDVFARNCSGGLKFVDVIETIEEGNECVMENGDDGVCKKLTDCPSRLEEVRKGRRNAGSTGRCGWDGPMEIVCCPKTILQRPAEVVCQEYKGRGKVIKLDPTVGLYFDQVYYLYNGFEAKVNEFPYAVALGYKDTNTDTNSSSLKYTCGGTLISLQHVLTAAHCVNNIQNSVPIEVRLGDVDIKSTTYNVQRIPISDIISHPEYRRHSVYHDVAIIKLKTKVQMSNSAKPICLETKPVNSLSMTSDTSLVAVGWGTTGVAENTSDKLMRTPSLSLVNKEECRKYYPESFRLSRGIDDTMFCARDNNSSRRSDACYGDSGGPMLMLAKSDESVVGVTAFGSGCGSVVPGIYTSVYSYLDWIEEQVWTNTAGF
ncbi:transmembrane protease serine 9-like [Calliopsis andreniformis]|uniref:transmembrane protease serine 9-like n=1 Tax=Calliopsis andreniformis TaxID=337506 RepID=UPI003FCE888B